MSRIDDLIRKHCPNGVVRRSIESFATCISGATPKSGVSSYWEGGTIPWMSSGEVNKKTVHETESFITQEGFDSCSTRMIPRNSVVIALAGQGKTRGMVARTRIELCTNQSLCSVVLNDEVNCDFLFHFLSSQYQVLRSISSGEGTRGGLNLGMIREFEVPVPPMEVQLEIVRVLDTFQELEAELEARKEQYAYYRRELLTFDMSRSDVEFLKLAEVANFTNAKAHERLADPEGEIALLTSRFISTQGRQARYVKQADVRTPAVRNQTALVMSDLPNGRALARAFFVDQDGKYAANQRVCLVDPRDEERVLPRFLYYILDRNQQLLRYDSGFDQTHLSKDQILGIQIPVPPLEVQEEIVEILDKFDALVNDISVGLPAELNARRRQYEYYRDRLLSFEADA